MKRWLPLLFLLLAAPALAHVPAWSTFDPHASLGLGTAAATVGYDNIGQLTSWSGKEAAGALRMNEQRGWNYDDAGNLNFRTNAALLQTFTVNDANELTGVTRNTSFTLTGNTPTPATNVTVNSVSADRYNDFTFARTNLTLANGNNNFTVIAKNPHGLSVTNSWTQNLPQNITLQSDANGNLTNDGLKSFFYDAENQLTNITVASQWKSEFVYDGFGRRRVAKDYGWQTGQWVKTNETRYVYDGLLAIQERDANNATLVAYTRGLDLSGSRAGVGGIGGLLARTDASGSAFYHNDGAGNVTALMNSTGELVARYLYDPFGNLVGKWGTLADANRYRFSSKEVHSLSGLYYYGFRFYEPNLQRWLNADPIGEAGGINLYGFVGNSPLNYIDPLGLEDMGMFVGGHNQETLEVQQAWLEGFFEGFMENFKEDYGEINGQPVLGGTPPLPGAKGANIICKKLGSYVHKFRSSKKYIGKGTEERMARSGKKLEKTTGDKLVDSKFEPSKPNTHKQALLDEAKKIEKSGGVPNKDLYKKINSPGKKDLPP